MSILLGCIADDFAGASELAGLLARSGVAVNLRLGVPPDGGADGADVAPFEVVALECRTSPAAEAVADALGAWDWLAARGAARCYWKYGATFDSGPEGNIGPVADALLDALAASPRLAVHAPSSPEHGRTVYRGRLFVGDPPPDEDPMRERPSTPMRDGDLVRLLASQTPSPVAKLTWPTVRAGREAIAASLDALADRGVAHVIADALEDLDLVGLVRGTESLPLLCGDGAFASHVPALCRVRGILPPDAPPPVRPRATGARLVLAGGRSAATREQIRAWPADWPSLRLEADALVDGGGLDAARERLADALGDAPVLVHSSAAPDEIAAVRDRLGAERAGAPFEDALGALALEGVRLGVGQLVVAGGRSSGAVARALGIERLGVGFEICPGVPWCTASLDGREVALAIEPGNAGGPGFLAEAFERLAAPPGDGAVPEDAGLSPVR